ncbi:MAG: hypothetical protein ACKVP3_09610 [Hyphomicrobiaceae bacterium]
MSFLRIWFLATGAVVLLALIWSFAPILIPLVVLTAGLGVIVAGVVAAARWLERARQRPGDGNP